MSYTAGCHTIFHHRYHIVWVPKYRHKVLRGEIWECVRAIVRQFCKEMSEQLFVAYERAVPVLLMKGSNLFINDKNGSSRF